MFRHAIEDDPGMKSGAFDGSEEFVLRGGLQIPAESDAAEIGIDEHRAVAVVPGHAEQTGLAGAVGFDALRESLHVSASASGDRVKNIADGGKAGLDAGMFGMHAAGDGAANSGN